MGWIDQTMAKLFRSASSGVDANAEKLRLSQRAWLKQRDRCNGSGNDVMECVSASYNTRFASIASLFDQEKITGQYSGDAYEGYLDAVLLPNRTLAVYISSSRGAPSYNSCELDFEAPFVSGKVHYIDQAEKACIVDLLIKGSIITVKQKGCESYCGANTDFAGSYSRMP